MHIEYVTLQNFGPHASFEVELKQGLVGIFGRNGCGKSTLVNGIYAALTNDFGRFDGTKADCIFDNAGEKEHSFIEVEAVHEGTQFTLRRSLKPNKSSLKIAGEKEVTKATEIEARLRTDLGVDMKLVDTYVFVDQWMMFQFLNHTPSQRADAFKHLCRTGKAEVIHDVLGTFVQKHIPSDEFVDNSDALVTAIGGLETEIEGLESKINVAKRKKLNDKSKASADKIVKKRERHDDAVEDLDTARSELETMEGDQKKRVSRLAKKNRAVSQKERSLEELGRKATRAKAALVHWKTYDKRKKRKDDLGAKFEKLHREPAKHIKPVPPDDMDKLNEYRTQKANKELALEQATSVVEAYDEAGTGRCPTCTQEIDAKFVDTQRQEMESLPDVIETLEERIEAIEQHQQDMADWEKWETSFKERDAALRDEMDELKSLKEPSGNRDELQDQVDDHDTEREALDDLEEDRDELKGTVDRETGRIEQKKARVTELEQKVKDNEVDDELFDKAKRRLDEHAAAELEIAELSGTLQGKQDEVEGKQTELDEVRAVKKRRKKLTRVMKVAQRVREVFHWNQLPRIVAQGNLVNMESDINDTLGWFGSPFWAEADENLGFQVHFPGRPPRRAEGLSGGQKGVFAISFRVSVNTLFGADIGMMFLDEPTVGLDDENMDFFADALNKLAVEVRGKRQLVVITHERDLRSSFDQVIEI